MTPSPLFDDVVAATRLNRLVAPFTVSRLLTRASVLPDELTPASLARAIDHFEEGLAVYLDPDELEAAIEDIRRLAAA